MTCFAPTDVLSIGLACLAIGMAGSVVFITWGWGS